MKNFNNEEINNNELSYEKSRLLDHISGYGDLNMHESAINECEKLIKLDPNDPDSFIQLGFHYEENAEIDKAVGCYRFMMKEFPKCSKPYVNLGYIFETHKKRNDMAIICYEKASELNPKDEWALNNIAVILQKEGKWEDALSYYEKASIVSKENDGGLACYQIVHNLAWAYYHCKDYTKAWLIYADLISEYSDNASMHCDLGCVNYKMGGYKRALNLFEKALSIQPDNRHYRRLYQVTDKKINKY